MDVDETDPQITPPAAVDVEALVTQLGAVLEQVASEPNNLLLLRRQCDLMLQVGMVDEAVDTASTFSQISFLGEVLWRRILDAKIASLAQPVGLDAFVNVLELFQSAQEEYLCEFSLECCRGSLCTPLTAALAILEQHAKFLVGLVAPASEGKVTGDDEVREYLNAETLRGMLRDVAEKTNGLLSSSQAVWQVWIDWEVSLLDGLTSSEK